MKKLWMKAVIQALLDRMEMAEFFGIQLPRDESDFYVTMYWQIASNGRKVGAKSRT